MSLPLPPSSESPAAESDRDQWFEREVYAHGAQLKAYLQGNFPAVRDLEDVIQESYLRIWKARMVRPITSAKAYLFSVARHLSLNLLRRDRRSPLVLEGDIEALGVIEDKPSVAEQLSEQEKIEMLTDALTALPGRTREIIVLHKFEGLAQSEIARRMGITEKAVERQVARGVLLCTEFFRARGHDFF